MGAEAGLAERPLRRAPGLRREELAREAGVSVDYLSRLEQGRAGNPSPQVLDALARALRLSDQERAHLFHAALARHPGDPRLRRLVDRLRARPERFEALARLSLQVA